MALKNDADPIVGWVRYATTCPHCGEENETEYDPRGEVVECDNCSHTYIPDETSGEYLEIDCETCGDVFTIERTGEAAAIECETCHARYTVTEERG